MTKGEFYSGEGVPNEEIERLKNFAYPNQVSAQILGNMDISGKIVADIGSGPNPELGEFILSKKGRYVPVDLRPEMLEELKESLESGEDFYGVIADVKQLPFANSSVDIAHQRFVLMHLSEEGRLKAINELSRITS